MHNLFNAPYLSYLQIAFRAHSQGMSRHQMCCSSTIGWVPVLHKACGVLTAAAAPAATVRWWSFGITWSGGGGAGEFAGGGAAAASAALYIWDYSICMLY